MTLQTQLSYVGFASDSASVMVGKRKSVLIRVIQKQSDVFLLRMCVSSCCFLSCAAAALKKLPDTCALL